MRIAADLGDATYRTPPRAVPFKQAAADYLSSLKTDGRSPKTLVKYAGVLNGFDGFLVARRASNLSQVTPAMFDQWRAARRAARHPKTVYTESVVKQLFKWARSRKLILEDPPAGIRLNKPAAEPKGCPTLGQVEAVLAAADAQLKEWLTVLAFTGMRVGELQRLRPEDVDLAGNWIHVRSRKGAETKTRESRKIPIHPRLRTGLAARSASRSPWFFTAGPSAKHPAGGNWINPKRVNDRLARILGESGLQAGR